MIQTPAMSRPPQSSWQTLAEQAMLHRRRGDHAAAIIAYRAALDVPGAPPELHFNLGNALCDHGLWAEAEAPLAQALAGNPGLTVAALQLARTRARLGRHEEAARGFAAVLRGEPGNFNAALEGGHALRRLGREAEALTCYGMAIQAAPNRWEGHLAMARALEETGRADEGAAHYHQALALAGDRPRRLHAHMAQYRLERGAAALALESLRQAMLCAALEQPPPGGDDWARMRLDLTAILLRLGLREAAEATLAEATQGTEDETILVQAAELALRHNLWQEALAILRRNVSLRPDNAAAHWNLAHMLSEAWHMEEALEALARAEALAPQPGAGPMRASIASRQGEADVALKLFLDQVEAGDTALGSGAAMSALYADSIGATEVAALHKRLFAHLGEGARPVASFRNSRDAGRPLRVGMITPDLHHQHPVNIFMQPVLARWDQTAMPTHLYFTGVSHDEETRLARGRVTHWVECAPWTDSQLARRIESDGIDILIDLSGHTQRGRMPLFGKRAAPVQVTFLGYPGSSGVPNMDWIIADPQVAPAGSEPLFSERVMRLPHTVFCFAPAPDSHYPQFGPAHAARPLTFGSFNNLPKLTPRTLGLWAAILHRLPDSRLLVKAPSFRDPGAISGFARRMAALGIPAERLELRGPTGMIEMMAEYADLDIALDPVPYNGGTTTLQAMWMGAPVVARRGEAFVSRMGASFMAAAGLGDWVADSDEAYVETAVRQGSDRAALLALKQGLRARLLAAPAWDIDRYTRDLQAALRAIWQDFCEAPVQARR